MEEDPQDGQLEVSLTVRDRTGEVVAVLRRNEWQVNQPAKAMDRNYTRNTLEVIDHTGLVVLQVRLLPDRAQVNGIFYGPDRWGIAILPPRDRVWPEGATPYVILGPDTPVPPSTLVPIFRYPSYLHFGELAQE